LYSNHNELLPGHLGFAKCFKKISQRYYWNGLGWEKYIKGCPDCQARKGHVGLKPPGLLQPIEIPSHPFEKIGIDLLGPFRRSVRGKTINRRRHGLCYSLGYCGSPARWNCQTGCPISGRLRHHKTRSPSIPSQRSWHRLPVRVGDQSSQGNGDSLILYVLSSPNQWTHGEI
jgi:hypothetical protein